MSVVTVLAETTVGVMGSGTEEHEVLARELGALLARLEVNLVTGGGAGVMRAVSRTYREGNPRKGICIGVLPCVEGNPAASPDSYPNEYVQLAIRTHLPHSGRRGKEPTSRNHINVLSCDAVVALPGGAGTASEVDLACDYGKPVIVFAPDESLVSHFTERATRVTSIAEVEEFLRRVTGIS